MKASADTVRLTRRERELLAEIVEGRTNGAIAQRVRRPGTDRAEPIDGAVREVWCLDPARARDVCRP